MKSKVQVRMRYPAFCNIDFDSQAMCEFTRMREHKSMKATRHRSTTLIAVVEIIYTSGASEIDAFIDLLLIAASTRTEIARSMASFTLALLSAALLLCSAAQAQLSSSFYSRTCPSLQRIVQSTMAQAVNKEPRMAASILRLFFHDCFVNGCDASILLDDTATFTGEKNAFPNINSARGYEVIDAIKSNVEAACPRTVSCADILALAARDGVSLVGGPNWKVALGRRDATTASQSDANSNLPGPSSSVSQLVTSFAAKGLSARDMTALSGAHTIGRTQCANFRSHIYDDANIDPGFAAARRRECPSAGGDGNLAPFDLQKPDRFDNSYYQNLVAKRGMLHSDQELFNNGTQDKLVRRYSVNGKAFAKDFASAMMRMGAISPLTGASGEIRLNCRVVNK